MIFPDISQIKKKRKEIGLTQKQIAKESGVSQSLIAKIEYGKAEASYEKIKRIFETLDRLKKQEDETAEDIMTKKIISIGQDKKVSEAVKIMKETGVSQLPVISRKRQVGSISETGILNRMIEDKTVEKKRIAEIMDEAFPTINKEIPVSALIQILKESDVVLVVEKNIPVGVISKSDVL